MMEMSLFNILFCALVVVGPSGAQAGDPTDGLAKVLGAMSSLADVSSSWGLGQIARFVEANVFHAAIDAVLPTNPLLRLSGAMDFSQIRRCPRADVHKCLYYGNSSNGLPPQLHGVLWQNGVGFDEATVMEVVQDSEKYFQANSCDGVVTGLLNPASTWKQQRGVLENNVVGFEQVAISPVGDWDPVKKTLYIGASRTRNWAARGTGSVKDSSGSYFLPAGSAHFNLLKSSQGAARIQFNENVTFGQIYATFPLFGIPITIPKSLIDWTMELMPDGSWKRVSRTFGLSEPDGDYLLKPIVTGDGTPGPFYDEWVKDMGGQDFLYLERIFP